MGIDDRNEQGKGYQSFRMGLDIGMGILYLCLGTGALYLRYFGNMPLNATYAMVLGCLMIGYGLFRLYRGTIVLFRKRKVEKTRF
ncbi:MAG: hypothetical protein V4649_14245 [Bacteroidota bacterium]